MKPFGQESKAQTHNNRLGDQVFLKQGSNELYQQKNSMYPIYQIIFSLQQIVCIRSH